MARNEIRPLIKLKSTSPDLNQNSIITTISSSENNVCKSGPAPSSNLSTDLSQVKINRGRGNCTLNEPSQFKSTDLNQVKLCLTTGKNVASVPALVSSSGEVSECQNRLSLSSQIPAPAAKLEETLSSDSEAHRAVPGNPKITQR